MLLSHETTFPVNRLLRNPHLQNLLSSGLPRRLALLPARRLLRNRQQLLLTWNQNTLVGSLNSHPHSRGLVILLHGWEGSSESAYLVSAAATLYRAGYDIFRLNLRDHGPTHHLNRELFNSTLTEETAQAMCQVRDHYPDQPCHLAGFSLGGSFALRIAADCSSDLDLCTVTAVSPPVNPARVMDELNARSRTYGAYFYRKWKRSLTTKLRHFPDLGYRDALDASRNLDDLNEFFVPGHTPYSTVADYFAAYSIAGDRLAGLNIPAWLITALDDPVVPVADILTISKSVPINIEITEFGSHCAFLQDFRMHSWIDGRLLEIIESRGAADSSTGSSQIFSVLAQ